MKNWWQRSGPVTCNPLPALKASSSKAQPISRNGSSGCSMTSGLLLLHRARRRKRLIIFLTFNTRIMNDRMEYVLVLWPDVQALMNYAWFDAECYLLNPLEDQEYYDSAYFVPKHRLDEIAQPTAEIK